jgi:type VI secretion system secreted protein Hcp
MTNAYLTAQGQQQGALKGDVTAKGREGSVALTTLAHELTSPRDPASGLPTGKLQHKPIVIAKVVDQASPQLLQAMVNNENLTSVRIELWRSGAEVAAPYFVMVLTNATISDIAFATSNDGQSESEQLSFTYQKIVWSYPGSGASVESDWGS